MTRMQNQYYDFQRGYLDSDVWEDGLMNAATLRGHSESSYIPHFAGNLELDQVSFP